jgi:hypothetical protein
MRQFINEEGAKFSSFLDAVSSGNYKIPSRLDKTALLEFLTFGSIYGEKTFLMGIKKEATHQPYSINPETGWIEEIQCMNNPLQSSQNLSIEEVKDNFIDFFRPLKDRFAGRKISIDLTGGIDSRLIAALLLYLEIPFDAVYSRLSGGEREQIIVERIAQEFGIPLKIISPPDEITSADEINDLVELGDGMWDPLGLRSMRMTQSWRKENNYDLAITGAGGELYKDFWWQQDFPFYRRNNPRLSRLLHMRMYPAILPRDWLGREIRTKFDPFIPDFISRLENYKQELNTQTYDQIYYHLRIKEQISVLSHASANYLPVWSPLLEPELLKAGYNLRRRDRFFNRFHRAVISECNTQLANIPTSDGEMTVSNDPVDLVKDMFRFTRQKSKRVFTHFRKGRPEPTPGSESVNLSIHTEVSKVIDGLKKVDLFSDEAPDEPSEYPDILHGRLLAIGYLIDRLS